MQVTEKMFGGYPMRADQSPDGLLVHTAGQSDQGWYVYDIWESKEHFERFVADKLGPALHELAVGEDSQPEPMFTSTYRGLATGSGRRRCFGIETLVKGPAF